MCGDDEVLIIFRRGQRADCVLVFVAGALQTRYMEGRGPLGEHGAWWIGTSMSQQTMENQWLHDATCPLTGTHTQEMRSGRCRMQ
jgi:hypothetical protein